jgi:hypothetical protein
MTEFLFVLAATIAVFALFFLVFFGNKRSDGDEVGRPTCAQCDCHGSEAQHERSCTRPGKTENQDARL